FVFLRCLTFSLAALLDEPPFLASFRGDFAFLRCLTFSLAALLEEPPFLIGFLGGTAMSTADLSTSLTAARFAGRGRFAKSRRSRIWIRFGSKQAFHHGSAAFGLPGSHRVKGGSFAFTVCMTLRK